MNSKYRQKYRHTPLAARSRNPFTVAIDTHITGQRSVTGQTILMGPIGAQPGTWVGSPEEVGLITRRS